MYRTYLHTTARRLEDESTHFVRSRGGAADGCDCAGCQILTAWWDASGSDTGFLYYRSDADEGSQQCSEAGEVLALAITADGVVLAKGEEILCDAEVYGPRYSHRFASQLRVQWVNFESESRLAGKKTQCPVMG